MALAYTGIQYTQLKTPPHPQLPRQGLVDLLIPPLRKTTIQAMTNQTTRKNVQNQTPSNTPMLEGIPVSTTMKLCSPAQSHRLIFQL